MTDGQDKSQYHTIELWLNEKMKSGTDLESIKPVMLYEAFPGIKKDTLRTYLNRYKTKHGIQVQHESAHTTTSADNLQVQSTTICTTTIDNETMSLLKTLKENRAFVEALIEKEKNKEARIMIQGVSFDVEGLVKTGKNHNKDYSYNISKDLHDEFETACKALGLSQRKGLHLAMKILIDAAKS
ncbi:MAG: hypothetical protein HQL05_16020 [Nitrospirae bacterium]|nr:hypothetical protein [Nitrospirota bacterium]